jgi:hypothetical protein
MLRKCPKTRYGEFRIVQPKCVAEDAEKIENAETSLKFSGISVISAFSDSK